jgi:hypothetical protein
MEINKQLFEDVLSGKLKGTFVLKNGKKFNDSLLTDIYNATAVVGKATYYFNGKPIVSDYNGILDIVDFIPDIGKIEIDPEMYSYNEKDIQFIEHFIKGYHMKENELTIEIPDNKIVDWDESKKQNKIVLKDKQLTYKDICKKLFKNIAYYTDLNGKINSGCTDYVTDPNNATNRHQLKCILAKNMLANVAKYLNDGWKPVYNDEEIWVILSFISGIHPVKVMQNSMVSCSGTILFKSEELARQAIEILGEETVKLALEPLGI